MPRSQVDFIKNIFKDFDLGNVFVVRSRRPSKNGCTQRSSIATYDERDNTIPANFPNDFPFASPTLPSDSSSAYPVSATRDPRFGVSTNASSARSFGGVPPARETLDIALLALPLVQGVAAVIPFVGPPMQTAISGLLTILQAIDRRIQNKADLNRLTERLHRLSCHLWNAPTARDPFEQRRRDSIVRILQETSAQLTNLYKRGLAYTSVTQAIAGCSTEIDRYLLECLWSFQMQQSQNDMRGSTAMQLTGAVARGCVTLVDATGHEYPISVNFCTSLQQLHSMLQVLFKRDSIEAQIQRRYMENGQYDLCIDDSKQVTRLTSHEWPRIEEGTKIVMRVIIEQKIRRSTSSAVDYRCHFCGAVHHLGDGSNIHSLERQAGCSIDCRECKRRFQISRDSTKFHTRSSNIANPRTDAEMLLIRNFYVQQSDPDPLEEFREFVFKERRWLEEYKKRKGLHTTQDDTVLYIQQDRVLSSNVSDVEYEHGDIEDLEEDSDSDDTENDSNGTEEEDVLGADLEDEQEVADGEYCEDWEDNEQWEDHEDGE